LVGKVLDPETLEVIRYYKYEVPMNAVAISPLLNNERLTKPHLIVAGGIPARETARTKFQGFDIHICNIIYEEEVGKFLSKYIHPYTYRFKSNWTYQFT
jgi:translation initiation factor 3 subunit I